MAETYATPASRMYKMFYFERMYSYINSELREHINSFLHVEDAIRSLAGDWSVCAFSILPVGIDIEMVHESGYCFRRYNFEFGYKFAPVALKRNLVTI
jgi:phosphopantetheinyl transferase